MKARRIARICTGQDGAIWGRFLFRFQNNGECCVYDLDALSALEGDAAAALSRFRLDKSELLEPHSNAVVFGSEYAETGDEFPLLYSNIYNNYAKAEDRLEGLCCVYRLRRDGLQFSTELVQLIQIGFTKDTALWSSANGQDVRPYGNFVVDREAGRYYAFTMRDESNATRYFSFRLPRLSEGCMDARFGVRRVELTGEDIIEYFDCPYHRYLQGACVHDGLIYSLEGFTNDPINSPALRIIDPRQRVQREVCALPEWGLCVEPEFIDFRDGQAYYTDHDGNLYEIQF